MNLVEKIQRRLKKIIQRLINIRKKRVLVLGDSHVKVFDLINRNSDLPIYFDVCHVAGATALGAVNPNSRTNALQVFTKKLRFTPKTRTIIIQLGEVDCGYLIWYLAQKRNEEVKHYFIRSLSNYQAFVKDHIINKGFKNVIIMSATLPTLKDHHENKGEIAGMRKEVKTSQIERTKITLEYNREMHNFSLALNLKFLDLDSELLDDQTGLIKSYFLHPDSSNHHNDPNKYSEIILQNISSINLDLNDKA